MILDWLYGGGGNAATVEMLGHPAAGVIGWTGPTGTSGVHVTPDTALGWSGVWAAQNKISGALASLPGKVSQKVGATRNDATEHSLYPVVHDEPNEDMDSFVFWEMMHNWWVGRGNAFAEKELNGAGEVMGLWPIHPTRVRVYQPRGGARRWLVLGNQGSPSVTIPWEDMLNIVGPLSDDGIIGRGVIDQALESIGVAIATERYMGAYFGNGARPAGVLEHPTKLSPEARSNIRKEWNQVHQGPDNSNKVAVLWEGMKYIKVGTDPEQSQLIEAAQFRITDMARWYDLPPHVLADLTRSTFSNIDSQQISLVVDSYRTRIIRVEKSLRRQLFTQRDKDRGFFVRFVLDGLLRGDPKMRAETSAIKLRHGAFTINDWLAQEDMNPIGPEGDKRFIEANMTTIDKVGEEKPAPPPNLPRLPVDDEEDTEIDDEDQDDEEEEEEARHQELLGGLKELKGIGTAAAAVFSSIQDGQNKLRDIASKLGTKHQAHEAAEDERHEVNVVEHKTTQSLNKSALAIESASCLRLARTVAAARAAIESRFSELVSKECDAARRRAKSPDNYLDKLESFYENHSSQMALALKAPISAWMEAIGRMDDPGIVAIRIAAAHVHQSKEMLLTAAECQPAELEASVEACVAEWPKRTINPEAGE